MSSRIDYTLPLAQAIYFDAPFVVKGGPSLTGEVPPLDFGAGRLALDDLARWQADRMTATYVVRSYNTPIAWRNAAGAWYVAVERFSVTTDRHRGMVKRALASLNVEV